MFVSLDDKEQRILISVSQCTAFVRNVYWIQTSVSLSRRRHQNQGVVGHTILAQTLSRRQGSCQVWIPVSRARGYSNSFQMETELDQTLSY